MEAATKIFMDIMNTMFAFSPETGDLLNGVFGNLVKFFASFGPFIQAISDIFAKMG